MNQPLSGSNSSVENGADLEPSERCVHLPRREHGATSQCGVETRQLSARPEPAGESGDNRKQNLMTANTRNSVQEDSNRRATASLSDGTGPNLSY